MNFHKKVNGSWTDIPHYIHKTDTNTITTLPAVIYANDTTATVVLKGDMSQVGTPTPTIPIQPNECGEISSNLFNEATSVYGKYIDGNGVEQTSSTGENNHSAYIPIKSGVQYTLAETKPSYDGIISAIAWYTSSKVFIQRDSVTLPNLAGRTSNTWTAPSNAAYAIINFYRYPYFDGENDMLNEGGTPLPYESYGQYKIPISFNNTTTPVYLGEVETTRKIKKLVLTGEETFTYYNTKSGKNVMNLSVPDSLNVTSGNNLVFCTHFPRCNQDEIYSETVERGISTRPGSQIIFYDTTIANTPTEFKSYVQQQYAAGTPVTVWYVLATPTTGIANEPIRKIGNYVDTVSGISIPTIAGANTLSVGTTLQPSEVTATYKGWHPVADAHEAENGSWT